MATLFSELERTANINCSTTYPGNVSPSIVTANGVTAAAVAATLAAQQQQQQHQHHQQQQHQHQQQSPPHTSICGSGGSSLHSSNVSPVSSITSSPTSASTNMSGGSCSSSSGISSISSANSAHLVEDSRALQLALELSMVGLSDPVSAAVVAAAVHHHNHQYMDAIPNSMNVSAPNGLPAATTLNQFASILPGIEDRSKKSQNMTECVPVPSSEHVAEIVGRQGCKIKALRAKTNTYIKTPVRGEEPVFVVTGRKEDVAKAKREILSAAEHFSLIRASRKPVIAGGLGKAPPGPPSIPGQVTIQVRVPYRVVGLVVGPKGATIKHIQQETHTYIVTPSRDKEPVFEVTGLPDNVQAARKQIEAHIALRTGNLSPSVHTINSLSQMLSDEVSPEFLASLYKNGICSGGFDYVETTTGNSIQQQQQVQQQQQQQTPNSINAMMNAAAANGINLGNNRYNSSIVNMNGNVGAGPNSVGVGVAGVVGGGSTGSRSCSSSSSSTSSKSAANSRPELMSIWKNLGDSIDVDEGLGESPNIWTMPAVASALGSSQSVSPTDSLLGGNDNSNGPLTLQPNGLLTSVGQNHHSQANHRRDCLVCGDREVNAAFVPCGHNMLCMECATRVRTTDGLCPVCSQPVVQAIHIKANY